MSDRRSRRGSVDSDEEKRAEKRAEAEAYVINRRREEERVAIVLAARDARLAALEKGENLAAPEYLPGPVNMCKFHLWSLPAFDHFVGDIRDNNWSSISFCQSYEAGAGPFAEVDPTKPVSGSIYLDHDNAFDLELFKAPERFMEPFPLTTLDYGRSPVTFQCTLIDEDHHVLHVPIELFLYQGGPIPAPDGAPKVLELFGIRNRKSDEGMMAGRLRAMASEATKKKKKKAKRNRRKRAAKPAPATSTPP
ncbi:hypothetical protein PG997_007157 [Apiospora hydei]|uniref:Uncharacterized protein n=1 Tax=Apiospora hydei TaxID=1337664 RepID=A0ABR1WQR9_9PEZI